MCVLVAAVAGFFINVLPAAAVPPIVEERTLPKHAYVAFGHMSQIIPYEGGSLVVFLARDKKGNEIVVGVNTEEMKMIYNSLFEPEGTHIQFLPP